jgi:DNA-binding response OmpR family regulator
MKVLVVEDDKRIRGLIEKGLGAEGFLVDAVGDGEAGYQLAKTRPYDAFILDIMVPGRDGLSLLKTLRAEGVNAPVLVVSARGELDQRVEGLNLGADDYLTKPFHIDELVARLRALGRRTGGAQLNLICAGNVTLNLATREVRRAGALVELTAREFALLELLLRAPGRVYTRAQILDYVWNYDFDPQTNLVDVYINRLRQKIGDPDSSLIDTVRGVGYRFRKDA